MSVTVSLTAEEQVALEAQAKFQGISVGVLLRNVVLEVISREQKSKERLTVEELDGAFEEIADMIPEGIPALSDQALSRETVYTRENEWNRNPR